MFKIQSKENGIVETLESYKQFSDLNFNSYDKVITGKYPAWMLNHKSHIVYMLHPLRGLYDTYHFCNLPTEFTYSEKFKNLKNLLDGVRSGDCKNVSDLIDSILSEVRSNSELLSFPSPFSREVIHALDSFGMSSGRIEKYSAISKTVAGRSDYFPSGANVDVLYPPPRLSGFFTGSDDYIFTSSRLDAPKRIDLLIKAMAFVESDINLYIGGKGPEEDKLKALAENDSRIKFLGYLDDKQLLDYYANSLAVPFVPYDEDYGLITIEAMKSGKPVITASDSGGVTEFVVDNETGLIVPPTPEAIGKAIEYVCMHRSIAKTMGINAKKSVSHITWKNVAEGLLDVKLESPKIYSSSGMSENKTDDIGKRKMLVAVTFPIYPPRGGGQSRIFNLYREWAKTFDITIVSLGNTDSEYSEQEIAPGLVEVRVPKSLDHQKEENIASEKVGWVPITDIVAIKEIWKTKQFTQCLKKYGLEADIAVVSHPYLVESLIESSPDAELWFEAHNVEFDVKSDILSNSIFKAKLLEDVKFCESLAWKSAKVVFACSDSDIRRLRELYGETTAKCLEIPNGFSKFEVDYVTFSKRKYLKEKIGINGSKVVLFMGSWHGPNLEAVDKIIEYAKQLPSVLFLIAGSAGLKYRDVVLPSNMRLLGVIDEKQKSIILSSVDLAINPMVSGSGSNLKMLDYMASGTPVISTSFGARGLSIVAGIHYIQSDIDNFGTAIMDFFVTMDASDKLQMAKVASESAFNHYEWEVISKIGLDDIFNKSSSSA